MDGGTTEADGLLATHAHAPALDVAYGVVEKPAQVLPLDNAAGDSLDMLTKVAYGQGHAVDGIKSYTFNTFVFFYYNQVLGLPPAACGVAVFIALFSDAVIDPVVGYVSDNYVSKRWGRRHGFLLLSIVPVTVSMWLLFHPFMVTYPLCRFAMSLFGVPFKALGAELSTQPSQRTQLFALAEVGGMVGYGAVPVLGYPLFFPSTPEYSNGVLNPAAYPRFGLAIGLLMVPLILVTVLGTRHRIPYMARAPHVSVIDDECRSGVPGARFFVRLLQLCENRPFRVLLLSNILQATVHSIEPTLSLYLNLHFWNLSSEEIAVLFLPASLGVPVAFVISLTVNHRVNKKYVVMAALTIYSIAASSCICLRLIGWFPSNASSHRLYYIGLSMAFQSATYALAGITLDSMLAEVADAIHLETGRRVEGMLFAVRSFASKAAVSIGGVLGGVVLAQIGFPRKAQMGEVPEEVVFRLGMVYGPLINTLSMVAAAIYFQYSLGPEEHHRIQEALKRRRQLHINEPEL